MKTEVMNGELKLYEFKHSKWSRVTDSESKHVLDKAPAVATGARIGDCLVKRTKGTDFRIKHGQSDRKAVFYKHGDCHFMRGKAHHYAN